MYPNYESYSKIIKEQEFHKQRIIFVIKDEKVFVNKYTKNSHEEWFKELGWDVEWVIENNINIKHYFCFK